MPQIPRPHPPPPRNAHAHALTNTHPTTQNHIGPNSDRIRSPDKDRLFCKHLVVGPIQTDTLFSVVAITNGTITQAFLPDAPALFDNNRIGGFDGEFEVVATTQLIADLDNDGQPEIALGITQKRGTFLLKLDPQDYKHYDRLRLDESNFKITSTRLLRIWKLGPNGFQRSTTLEGSFHHPYLLPYKTAEK